ncbi:hypothetical protein [Rhodococcus sp. NPDC004095]
MARNEVGFKGAKLVGAIVDTDANPEIVATAKIVTKDVTVNASSTSGTATVVAGSKVLGFYPAGNQDQHIDNVAIASTTLTVTLAAAATANNLFKVNVLEP